MIMWKWQWVGLLWQKAAVLCCRISFWCEFREQNRTPTTFSVFVVNSCFAAISPLFPAPTHALGMCQGAAIA
jgi:hypothetical protein